MAWPQVILQGQKSSIYIECVVLTRQAVEFEEGCMWVPDTAWSVFSLLPQLSLRVHPDIVGLLPSSNFQGVWHREVSNNSSSQTCWSSISHSCGYHILFYKYGIYTKVNLTSRRNRDHRSSANWHNIKKHWLYRPSNCKSTFLFVHPCFYPSASRKVSMLLWIIYDRVWLSISKRSLKITCSLN